MLRRLISLTLIAAFLGAASPAPALAMSTQQEIDLGKQADEQIAQTSVFERDPLLNEWVQGVARKLWHQVARKDVPYNVKIINTSDINAFSTLGGYVYVNEGLLDFVQSDDELAGVIGHETGHIERRHVVTMTAKAQALNLLFGIASLFSPIVYRLGNLAEAGILAKLSRVDELQADQYGLLLMSRAGYDPNAMVTFMKHLGVLEGEHSDLVSKYLQDHPNPTDRVKHLVGYPELDPTKVTDQERLVWALHDLDEARYNVSMLELTQLVKTMPQSEEALLALGEDQLALGQTSKSAQTLGEAAQHGSPAAKQVALQQIAALREMQVHSVNLLQPNLTDLQRKMQAALQTQSQAVAQISARHDQGRDQLKALRGRLDDISYEIPDFSNIQIRPRSRLEAVVKNLSGMARSINFALDQTNSAINGVGSIDAKTEKPTGLLWENSDILTEMQAPLKLSPIPSDSIAIFPSYPTMFGELAAADADMIRSVDAGRVAAMQLDSGLGDLDAFLKRLQQVQLNYFGDISTYDYQDLVPLMQKADASLGQAAVSASQANQLFNMARSRELAARITLLGVGTSPQRYATLQKAIGVRFPDVGVSYEQMLRDNLTPGQVTAASIVAADTDTTPAAVIAQAQKTHRSIVDVANDRGVHAEALEIFLGLIYLDYTDDPVKETSPAST